MSALLFCSIGFLGGGGGGCRQAHWGIVAGKEGEEKWCCCRVTLGDWGIGHGGWDSPIFTNFSFGIMSLDSNSGHNFFPPVISKNGRFCPLRLLPFSISRLVWPARPFSIETFALLTQLFRADVAVAIEIWVFHSCSNAGWKGFPPSLFPGVQYSFLSRKTKS